MRKIISLTNKVNVNREEIGKISPFATREDEELIRFVEEKPWGITLQAIDMDIVKVVAKFLIVSSKMLCTMLPQYDEESIKYHLHKLCKSNFLYRGEFQNKNGGCSSAKLYAVSSRGRGLLYNMGSEVRMTQYVANLDSCAAKKLLSAIQYTISQGYSDADSMFNTQTASVVFAVPKGGMRATVAFRPQMIVYRDNNAVEFVESVRQYGKVDVCEKLDRMVNILSKKNINIPVDKNFKTVLVCEDFEHMLRVMELTNHRKYRSLKIVYTYDVASFLRPLDCLYECMPQKGFFASLVSCF